MDRMPVPSGNGRLLEGSEVPEKPTRRQFPAAYKLKVLRELDRLNGSGDIGALLRREGLYSSLISTWRRQRERGELSGLGQKSTSQKAVQEKKDLEIRRLKRENARLERKFKQAEIVIDIQKKISEMLDIPLNSPESGRDA